MAGTAGILLTLFLWLSGCFLGPGAEGALGESEDTIALDIQAHSAGRTASRTSANYTVHEIDSGFLVIRQFVAPSGVVFAVVWKGLSQPDLTVLLGSFVDEYEAGLRTTKREPGSRHVRVKTSRLVVEKWGQMRSVQGRAYVPDLVPAGVDIHEIK